MTYLRVQVVDDNRATQIQDDLLESKEMIDALMKTPWFLALRNINRRLEQHKYNEDGEPWVDIPKDSHDAKAVEKLNRLFPDLLVIEEVKL